VYHCPYCGKSKSNRKIEKALRTLLDTIPLSAERIAAAGSTQGSATGSVEVEQQLARLQKRRATLMEMKADAESEDDKRAAQEALDKNARDLAELRTQQVAAARAQAADHAVAVTVAWLERLGSWTELLDGASVVERNEVYRKLMARCTVDFAAATLTVEWQPAIARLTGHAVQTVSLATQPRRKSKKH
jgi:hypothetical protein